MASSQVGEANASSSRNATTSPREAATPLLRAPDAPGRRMLGTTIAPGSSRLARSSRPGLWSITTIVSVTLAVWAAIDATAWQRSSQRSIANAAVITEIVGEPVRSAWSLLKLALLKATVIGWSARGPAGRGRCGGGRQRVGGRRRRRD